MIEGLFVLIPFGFALAYAILGGVEFGLPLAGFLHDKAARKAGVPHFSPVWECSNLLLIGAIVSTVLIFPAALPVVVSLLQPLWLVIVGLLAVRALLVLAHYHLRGKDSGFLRWGLVTVSLALPATLIQNVTVLITGDSNLLDHLAITIALGLLAVVLAIALWSGFFYQPGKKVREVARTSFWFGLLSATSTLPLALSLDPGLLADSNVVANCWPLFAGAVAAILLLMNPVRRRYFVASSVLAASVALTLLFFQLPYLVQPAVRLDAAILEPATRVSVTAAILILVVAVPCLLVLRRVALRKH